MVKVPYYQNYSQNLIDKYMKQLIAGHIEDEIPYVIGMIAMIYRGLKDNLYLAVADVSQCDPTYAKLAYYRDLFKQSRPAFKYSIYSNYVVIIMSTDQEVFYPKRSLNRLNRLFKENNIKVGISSRFENLFELSRYYGEAGNALNGGLKRDGSQLFLPVDNADDYA